MHAHTSIEVILATAHEMVSEALQTALSTFGIEQVREAHTEQQLLNLCVEHPRSFLLLDWLLPQRDKLATLDDIRYYYPQIQVLILANNLDNALTEIVERDDVKIFFQETLTIDDLANVFQLNYN